ncbi:MAG: fumarylacetoacetate hydrolase family protein [Rhodobacteraceae bacterium]|nr:fumarylacetoacetate hydrolase family protein [Paracoccaceae bacterium]
MPDYLFDPAPQKALPVQGTHALYPVRRIFCVGRNYAAHAAEMGGEVDREAPWYFTKSAEALCQSGTTVPYPVEDSAVIGPITPAAAAADLGPRRIWLTVNGERRQDAVLSDMVWSVPEIVAHLSGYYHLGPGDLIMTGTPAGVGPVGPGDTIEGGIDGLAPVRLVLGPPE